MPKFSLTVNNVNQHLSTLQLDIIENSNISNDNSNISNAGLSRGGLHLNSQGLGKLAINFIKKIKNFRRSLQIATYLVRKLRIVEAHTSLTLLLIISMIYMKSSLIFAHININSLRNKFEMLQEIIGNNIDVLLISEMKLDASFPSSQFILDGFTLTDRLDRTEN